MASPARDDAYHALQATDGDWPASAACWTARAVPSADISVDRADSLQHLVGRRLYEARRGLRMSIQDVVRSLSGSTSVTAYSRSESGVQVLSLNTLAQICSVLGMDLVDVLAAATSTVDARADGSTASSFTAPQLRPVDNQGAAGRQIPVIKVRIAHLLKRPMPPMDEIGARLMMHTTHAVDDRGDVTFDQSLIILIARHAEMDLLRCWQWLAGSIVHDAPSPT